MLFVLLLFFHVSGQEKLDFLDSNPILYKLKEEKHFEVQRSSNLELPLIIDFSEDSIVPSSYYFQNQFSRL